MITSKESGIAKPRVSTPKVLMQTLPTRQLRRLCFAIVQPAIWSSVCSYGSCSIFISADRLSLENYGSVLKDCSRAIQLNAHSSKAYYRSALALIALDRPDEALDCCERCLVFDQENTSVKATRDRAAKLVAEKTAKEQEKRKKLMEERIKRQRLRSAYEVCAWIQ